jgi:DNA-binding NarL/FixJ family response regulator
MTVRTCSDSVSDDEVALIAYLASGRSVKEIATTTGRHPNTVYHRLSRVRSRFGVHTDAELIAFAIRRRWI